MYLCKNCRDRLDNSNLPVTVPNEPEGKCELCGNLLEEVNVFYEMFKEESSHYEFETFLIGVRTIKGSEERDKRLVEEGGGKSKTFKQQFQYLLGTAIEESLPYRVDFLKPDLVFTINQKYEDYDLWIRPIYVRGRYLKKRRGIPQSPWIKPGRGKEEERSVSEYIGSQICSSFRGKNYNFFASGREDVDALMLGTGRPFYVEIESPRRRKVDLSLLPGQVSVSSRGGVDVLELHLSGQDEIEVMKRMRPDKLYEVGLTVEGELNKDLERSILSLSNSRIKQRTPTRVLPIRSDTLREREIKSIEIVELKGNNLVLRIRAEAGTYIKEFITGDRGRTVPNLSETMEVNVKIDYLNVLEVK